MIELGKDYQTRDKEKVILFAIFPEQKYPVMGAVSQHGQWKPRTWAINGQWGDRENSSRDLMEVSHYENFKIDDEVLVWDSIQLNRIRGNYAGLDEYGRPTTWPDGRTSWTGRGAEPISWDFCEKNPGAK